MSPYASMLRQLTPEILDSLPPDDPRAQHSRRDLRMFNAVLGSGRWFRRTLPACLCPGEHVLEIGAGAGELGAALAKTGVVVDGLDLGPPPAGWPVSARWHQTDVFKFADWGDYQVVIGNLIFHHFDAEGLRRIGVQLAAHARVIVAFELARWPLSRPLFAALCTVVRANDVSRHDGRVSIEAGFLGDELPELLGLEPTRWRWQVTTTTTGAYRLVAERRA